jgi:carboxy-cis,cis-muconate cyclase
MPASLYASYLLCVKSDPKDIFWSDDVALSASNKFLYATSRNMNGTNPGHISAFSLSKSGAIQKQLFLSPTTTSGGAANAPAPAPWSDRFVALTDTQIGGLEVWEVADKDGKGESRMNLPKAVAKLTLDDKAWALANSGRTGKTGCYANAVWLD